VEQLTAKLDKGLAINRKLKSRSATVTQYENEGLIADINALLEPNKELLYRPKAPCQDLSALSSELNVPD
jgi:hypothetical protein